jgi:deoxyribonuclease IV
LNKLLFGPAGVPASSPGRSTVEGIPQVRKLNLGNMEMEFVQGVRMGLETAKQVKEVATKNEVILTAHGPYYINLNSNEKAKSEASIKRILDTARIGNACGAYSVTFHAAYYQATPKEKVYEIVRSHMKTIIKTLQNEGINKIWVRPETTGKGTQFGEVDEIIKLGQEVEQVMPCVDFSHLHARSNGKYNTYAEFSSVLEKLEKGFGKEGLNNMHVHVSGIAYGDKGEKHHLILKESDMNYKDLMKAFRDYKVKGVIVCESPNQEVDAQLMKSEYEKA